MFERRIELYDRSLFLHTKDIPLEVLKLSSYKVIKNHTSKEIACDIILKRGQHLQIVGPNGIGKTTLLESLVFGARNW